MDGDTGGNDCVHVYEVPPGSSTAVGAGAALDVQLRDDTQVIIADEHGNVCQFTYQEWTDFAVKMTRGEFWHIGGTKSAKRVLDQVKRLLSGRESFPLPPGVLMAEASGTPEELRAVADALEDPEFVRHLTDSLSRPEDGVRRGRLQRHGCANPDHGHSLATGEQCIGIGSDSPHIMDGAHADYLAAPGGGERDCSRRDVHHAHVWHSDGEAVDFACGGVKPDPSGPTCSDPDHGSRHPIHADWESSDPFSQPPGRPSPVNESLAEIDAWDRRYGS